MTYTIVIVPLKIVNSRYPVPCPLLTESVRDESGMAPGGNMMLPSYCNDDHYFKQTFILGLSHLGVLHKAFVTLFSLRRDVVGILSVICEGKFVCMPD